MGVGPSVAAPRRVRRSNSWAVEDSWKLGDRTLSSSFKVQLQCAFHEVGTQRGCRSENYLQQRGYGALVGLHSNWIGHFILASARPTNRLLDEHHIIYQLHSQRIGAVVNLQEPGEHGACGDGVLPDSGFSYNPERFMEKHIFYFNFPLKDSKNVDPNYMLDICHTIDSQIAAGEKVHKYDGGWARLWYTAILDVVRTDLHSRFKSLHRKFIDAKPLNLITTLISLSKYMFGNIRPYSSRSQGRTGLVVGCYFLYSGAYDDPMEGIQAIETDREGTFRKNHQVKMVKEFNVYLQKLRLCFVSPEKLKKRSGDTAGYPNISEQMQRQRKILHGVERRALLYVPKIVDWTTRELIRRTDFNRQKREKVAAAFMLAFTTPINEVKTSKAKERINTADWGGVEELEVSVICQVLLVWLGQLQEPIVPDAIVTTALGRSDIESAIDELSKADKCSFATIQILACFIFQIVPVKPKLIRQLYSALAHVLLANSNLQDTPLEEVIPENLAAVEDKSQENGSGTPPKRRLSKIHDVYYKFKPTLLDVEYGLLLEASARFWIKLGKAKHEAQEKKKSKSSASSSPKEKEKLTIFSQPWFRDRASFQYEEYNPVADALQHKKDSETAEDGSSSSTSKTSSFDNPSSPRSSGGSRN